jgi:hypothetical protein
VRVELIVPSSFLPHRQGRVVVEIVCGGVGSTECSPSQGVNTTNNYRMITCPGVKLKDASEAVNEPSWRLLAPQSPKQGGDELRSRLQRGSQLGLSKRDPETP